MQNDYRIADNFLNYKFSEHDFNNAFLSSLECGKKLNMYKFKG